MEPWRRSTSEQGARSQAAAVERERKAVAARHEQILQALRAHDSDAAYQAMLDHDQKYERYASKTHADALKAPVRWGSRLA